MPIDPVDAALDAIGAHLAARDGIASAVRGWPEHGNEFDLSSGPVVTVSRAGEPKRTHVPPTEVDRATLPSGAFRLTYRVGYLEFDAQVDLWAAYRAQRDDAAQVVEDALHNRLPWKSGLELASTTYFGRPLSIEADGGFAEDNGDAVSVGEWRQTWTIRVSTDLVVQKTLQTQGTITIRPAIGPEVDIDQDPDAADDIDLT